MAKKKNFSNLSASCDYGNFVLGFKPIDIKKGNRGATHMLEGVLYFAGCFLLFEKRMECCPQERGYHEYGTSRGQFPAPAAEHYFFSVHTAVPSKGTADFFIRHISVCF